MSTLNLCSLLIVTGVLGTVCLEVRAADRLINHEVMVDASIDEAWKAWTTEQGLIRFGPPAASIDFRIGGKYEWYFVPDAPEGQRGAEGCTILSYVPQRQLSFAWNAPPKIPRLREAGVKTPVTVLFDEAASNLVRVRLTQVVSGEGKDWDEYYAYFSRAWGLVLNSLRDSYRPKAEPSAAMPQECMESLARLIGEWHSSGTFEDPAKGGMRVNYEWGLAKNTMKASSFIVEDGNATQVYETQIAWQPFQKTVVFRSVSTGGSLYDGTARWISPETLEFNWVDFQADQSRAWRQTLRFTDSNKYAWNVYLKEGDKWKQVKEGNFQKTNKG